MDEHVLIALSRRFPQLLLPLDPGTKASEAYKAMVLRGEGISGTPDFALDPGDSLSLCPTPAGEAELLFLARREDFEHCIRALVYHCEPRPIPRSMGAITVGGLIDWGKINAHKSEYLAAGGADWDGEFRRFAAERGSYTSTLIILSAGEYSSVSAEAVGLPQAQWLEKSVAIRKYHELTHFVCRRLYPGQTDAVRDELIADMNGIIAAFGSYDAGLAALFLGLEGQEYRQGGRLENYLEGASLADAVTRARGLMAELSEAFAHAGPEDIFTQLSRLYTAAGADRERP